MLSGKLRNLRRNNEPTKFYLHTDRTDLALWSDLG